MWRNGRIIAVDGTRPTHATKAAGTGLFSRHPMNCPANKSSPSPALPQRRRRPTAPDLADNLRYIADVLLGGEAPPRGVDGYEIAQAGLHLVVLVT